MQFTLCLPTRLCRCATQKGLPTRKTLRSIHILVMSFAMLVISAIILEQWPHEQIQHLKALSQDFPTKLLLQMTTALSCT